MIRHGDCLTVMAEMDAASVDAIVTDPPYGLGFMGKAWDTLPPGREWAEQCLRLLKPGGYMLAFGGTRTWHRLAVAVEDAGFEIRDSIAWLYGSGFPKSHASLKPAFEPIVVGRKPGAGLLNIDACRIDGPPKKTRNERVGDGCEDCNGIEIPPGRWPANVTLDEQQAAALDEQTGTLTSGSIRAGVTARSGRTSGGIMGDPVQRMRGDTVGDSGGASRFFYVAKAPAKERPRINDLAHPTVKPLSLMRWLVRLVTPNGGTVLDPFLGSGTTAEACILEGLNWVGIEREADYIALTEQRLAKHDGTLTFGAA